ncbi:uncharacterized protein J3D65DRAFT_634313 [Phyllosticta citribraziliensis]|uniref:Uncharacterized protein n=1 Tax=Phyllosticta citribraziliensis TaxID=989973 RepID=A0ABR1LEJ6_9PEZI
MSLFLSFLSPSHASPSTTSPTPAPYWIPCSTVSRRHTFRHVRSSSFSRTACAGAAVAAFAHPAGTVGVARCAREVSECVMCLSPFLVFGACSTLRVSSVFLLRLRWVLGLRSSKCWRVVLTIWAQLVRSGRIELDRIDRRWARGEDPGIGRSAGSINFLVVILR